MKSNKEILTIAANLAEMVLQARISPHLHHLQRIETIRSEIEVMRHHLHPSDEFLYFLVDQEFYQIKNKLLAQHRKTPLQPLSVTLHFTLFDKQTSTTQTAEIWKIVVHKKQLKKVGESDCLREMMNLIGQTIDHLSLQRGLSTLVRNREASKKYVIDFKVEIAPANRNSMLQKQFSLWNCWSRMNGQYQIELACYWRKNNPTFNLPNSSSIFSAKRERNCSQETQVDSISSLKQINVKRYRSSQQQLAYETYDSQLDVTIISSDSQSLSRSRNAVLEVRISEVDEFELLIEESTNQQELFVSENEGLFESWQQCLSLNFK